MATIEDVKNDSRRGQGARNAMILRAAAVGQSWIGLVSLALVWELFARSGLVTPFQLPTLTSVLGTIYTSALSGELWQSVQLTLYRTMSGFLIASTLGIALGVLMARNRTIRWFFDPLISIMFPVPKIVFLPIVILWLGFGDTTKIFMIVIDAFLPVLTATIAATSTVQRDLVWSAKSMGASRTELVREVLLPASMPQILTGLQVALPLSLIICIVTEMLTAGGGLGADMINASRFSNSKALFAGIVEVAVVGFVLIKLLAVARKHLLRWHPETAPPATV
ncbi:MULTISPECIES: ABC transporter permease [Rhizobium]|uniref:ABC-type nitrate/sulfonate/bicarbonate transport system permease component n=1 Tax=Rhizobium paranaense TaxID=1650438 RepID=A0A7W8XXS5_9HYPH|nr:ABC transporter permease [Rhizobium paranaense]MBB5577350.1 ABC-type nitrate/sulfonate/bicarbonate transport system permease component [Rhizobium paranaense]